MIVDRRITTYLYNKPMALHLYLPLHFCHAQGVLSGLVFGDILHIHQLCSDAWDIVKELSSFTTSLIKATNQLLVAIIDIQKVVLDD